MSKSSGVALHSDPVDVVRLLRSTIRVCARLTETEPAVLADRLFNVTLSWPNSEATDTMRQACTDILQAEVES